MSVGWIVGVAVSLVVMILVFAAWLVKKCLKKKVVNVRRTVYRHDDGIELTGLGARNSILRPAGAEPDLDLEQLPGMCNSIGFS